MVILIIIIMLNNIRDISSIKLQKETYFWFGVSEGVLDP